MGREWLYFDELKFPGKCPFCGSKRFVVEVARKVEFETMYKVTDEGIKLEGEKEINIEWEVVHGILCAECGEDLSDKAGF